MPSIAFRVRDVDRQTIRAEGVEAFNAPERLHALLEAQHYRLAHWRAANDLLNYRRFFEITTLAGVRIERPEAFDQRAPRSAATLCRRLDRRRAGRPRRRPHRSRRLLRAAARGDAGCDAAAAGRAARRRLYRRREHSGQRRDAADVADRGDDRLRFHERSLGAAAPRRRRGAAATVLGGDQRPRRRVSNEEERLARSELLDRNFAGQLESVVDLHPSRLRQAFGRSRSHARRGSPRAASRWSVICRVYRSYALGGADNPGAGAYLERGVHGGGCASRRATMRRWRRCGR